MRPTYETAADQSRERLIVDRVCERFGMKAVKLPQFRDIDFALMRGDAVWGVVEIKCRRQHYREMFLSFDKVQGLRNYAASGLQARVIFATPSGVFAKKIGPCEIDGWIGLGGRTDRGDNKDQELMCFFTTEGTEEKDPMTRICDSDKEWFA